MRTGEEQDRLARKIGLRRSRAAAGRREMFAAEAAAWRPRCWRHWNSRSTTCDAAIAGRGIALVPTFIAAGALQAGRLTTCLDTYQAPPPALYALYPPTRNLAARVRLFIDFLVKRLES